MEIKLKRLYIKDFNNIDELDLDMDYNVISLYGDTGSGKSSIVEAVQYLFTGSLNNRIVDYVKWGKKEFTIIGEFSVDADNFVYEVKGGKKTEKKLIVNDSEEFINSDATKKMEEFLDSTLLSFIISNQGMSDDVLFVGGAERLQKFKKLFKLDDIMKLIETMKEDKDEIVKEIRDNEVKLETLTNVKYIYQNVFEIVSDIDSLNKTLKSLEEELEVYNNNLSLYNTYVVLKEKYDLDNIKYENIKNKVLIKEHELNNIDNTGILNVLYNEADHNISIDKLNILKLSYSKLESAWLFYNKAQFDIQGIQKQIEENNKIIENNNIERLPRLSFTEDSLIGLSKEIQELNELRIYHKNKYEAIKSGKCPTCYAEYSLDNLKEFEDNSRDFDLAYTSLSKEYGEKVKQLKEYSDRENNNRLKQVKIDQAEKNIGDFNTIMSDLFLVSKPEKDLSDLQIDIENAFKIVEAYDKNKKEYLQYQIQLKDHENKRMLIQNELNLLVKEKDLMLFNDSMVSPVEVNKPKDFDSSQIDIVKKEINIYDQKVKERNNIIDFNNRIKEEERLTIQEILKLENILKDKKYKLTLINESIKVVDKDFTAWLIDKNSEFIKNQMNRFFSKTYNKYEISFENDGKSIEFFYGFDGIKAPINKASGYERQLIGLSFRLAILRLMNSNFFVGDEIDSNSADERSLDLYENILNEDYITQFINITHKSGTQEFLGNINNSIQYELKDGSLVN